jgi:hypothetical protein
MYIYVRVADFAGEWDKAHKLASQYLDSNEVSAMYISQAKTLEEQGKLRDAEKLYLYVSEPDMAISMYKKHHQYDQVRNIRIIFCAIRKTCSKCGTQSKSRLPFIWF